MAQKAGATTVSFVFKDNDYDSGWTESFQCNIGDLTQAADAAQAVAQARVGFLSARFSIEYIRTSKVQAPKVPPARNQRISYLRRVTFGGSLEPNGDGDLPFVAALVRFYNADKTVFALREFRGVPDSFWSDNSDKLVRPKINAPIQKYVNQLALGTFGINHKLPAGGVALVVIATGEYERLTHRITGRPLYLPRGRRTR